MDDGIDEFIVRFPPDFPLQDVMEIADELMRDGGIVPGYIPGGSGAFDLMSVQYSKLMGETTVILPDRNLISRIAAIAEGRARYPLDPPSQLAANLMAYCQCMGMDFEPSIAFHELGHRMGNDEANRELGWFRVGDAAQALAWVAVSRGRADGLGQLQPEASTKHDFAYPLRRWEKNYVVALRIADLELSDRSPLDRAIALVDWMMDDFFLAAPAAIFASMYFSPNAAKKRLMKHLRSADRERALDGVRNAAWDMTHLSELTRRMLDGDDPGKRYVFATADRGLAEIAALLPIDADEHQLEGELARLMGVWWPQPSVDIVAARFNDAILVASSRSAPSGPPGSEDPIGDMILEGERRARDWSP